MARAGRRVRTDPRVHGDTTSARPGPPTLRSQIRPRFRPRAQSRARLDHTLPAHPAHIARPSSWCTRMPHPASPPRATPLTALLVPLWSMCTPESRPSSSPIAVAFWDEGEDAGTHLPSPSGSCGSSVLARRVRPKMRRRFWARDSCSRTKIAYGAGTLIHSRATLTRSTVCAPNVH